MNKKLFVIFFLILIGFRFYTITFPSWYEKELVQVNIAENLATSQFNIFDTKLSFNLSFLDPFREIPIAWTEELPLFHLLAALGMKVLPLEPLLIGRLLSFVFFLIGCFYLFRFVKLEYSKDAAYWSLILFSLSPLTLAYSTYFMADIAMVGAFLGSLFHLSLYFKDKQTKHYVFALLWAIAFTTFRYYGVFLFIPLFAYWLRHHERSPKFFIFFLFPPLIEGAWLAYALLATDHPVGSQYHWGKWKEYLWDNSFYYEEMFLRLTKYSITFLGFFFFLVGIFKYRKDWFLMSSLAMIILSIGFFTQGHDIHWYYQFKFLPFLVILTALGIAEVCHKRRISFFLLIIFSFLAFKQAYKLMRYDSGPQILGEQIQKLTKSKDSLMIIQDVPDPGVFVYGKRKGRMVKLELLQELDLPRLYKMSDIAVIRISKENIVDNKHHILAEIARLKQNHKLLWELESPIGRHGKCGMKSFFSGECPREEYYLAIFKIS